MLMLKSGGPALSTVENWKTRILENEDRDFQYNLGVAYYYGYHVPASKQKALEYFHQSAAQGLDIAMIALGEMYLEGDGVAKSEKYGVSWIEKAVRHAETNEPLYLKEPVTGKFVTAREFLKEVL